MSGLLNTRRHPTLLALFLSGGCLLACGQEPNLNEPRRQNTDTDESNNADADLDDAGSNTSGDVSDTQSVAPVPAGGCTTVRREALGQVETTTAAEVVVVEEGTTGTLLYVDASAGGFQGSASHPYVYVNLDSRAKVTLNDFQADESLDWDLAFKRFTVRTNSADSGPGNGGAVGVVASFDEVSLERIDTAEILTDDFIDDTTCDIVAGDERIGGVWTPFAGWYDYDDTTMTLSPAAVTYVVRSANGSVYYKLEFVAYYATPDGGQGQVSGRYLVRFMKL